MERLSICLMNQIRETLKGFSKILERVAHLMPADVHRLLEREAQDLNSTILMNRRAYADLISNLLTGTLNTDFVKLMMCCCHI